MISSPGVGAAGVLQSDPGCPGPQHKEPAGVMLVEAQALSDGLAQGTGSPTQGPHLTWCLAQLLHSHLFRGC